MTTHSLWNDWTCELLDSAFLANPLSRQPLQKQTWCLSNGTFWEEPPEAGKVSRASRDWHTGHTGQAAFPCLAAQRLLRSCTWWKMRWFFSHRAVWSCSHLEPGLFVVLERESLKWSGLPGGFLWGSAAPVDVQPLQKSFSWLVFYLLTLLIILIWKNLLLNLTTRFAKI